MVKRFELELGEERVPRAPRQLQRPEGVCFLWEPVLCGLITKFEEAGGVSELLQAVSRENHRSSDNRVNDGANCCGDHSFVMTVDQQSRSQGVLYLE